MVSVTSCNKDDDPEPSDSNKSFKGIETQIGDFNPET